MAHCYERDQVEIKLKLDGSSRTREVTGCVYPALMKNLKTQMASTSPTPNLFLTNTPASEVEKSLIRQRVQEARHERRATEASLLSTSTESTKEEIRNRLQSLDDFIHDHEALLSSIRDLPPELLEDIFLRTTSWVRKFETDLDGEILEPDFEFILSLSQVCRYWRTVSIATPGMWTSIPALRKWQSDDPESEAFIYLLRIFIERSGNSPIHITVHIKELLNNLEDPDQLQSPCLQLLASQCHRWKTAILHVDKSIIRRLGELYTPDLESLNFRCRYAAALMNNAYYPRLYILAPRLTHAIIDNWQSHSFLRLAHFNIRTFTGLPDHLDVLRRAGPTLEACSFRGPVSMMQYPTEPIHFAKMHFLSIINNNYQHPWVSFGHHNETPFRWMNAPNLTFLEIRGHPVHPGASLIVSDLLSNTLSPSSLLRSFTFHVRGLSEDEFTRLLSAMPLLIILDICDTPSHYFSALVRRKPDDPQKPLVPRLMSIRIQDFSDRDAKPLTELCDSCELKKSGYQFEDDLCIDLFYSSSRLCLQAQDRIEGWDSETWIKQRVPGSELSKIFGWAAFIANHFLARDGQSEKYGVGPLSALSANLKPLFVLVPSESKTPFSGTFTVGRHKR